MVTLDPELALTALRIVGDFGRKRDAIGTGFGVTGAGERDDDWAYVLTAHHVIEHQKSVEIQAPDPARPGTTSPPIAVEGWHQPVPELDLAIAPLPRDSGFPIVALRMGWHVVPELDMAPHLGGTFHYVGLLAPLDRPMVRSGTIGAVDQAGVSHDSDDYNYTCHLADCRSYGGFSGSPCFLEIPFAGLTEKCVPPWLPQPPRPVGRITYTHVLCGMFTEHLDSEDPVKAVSRLGVGIMLRAADICRAIAVARGSA